jgi:hypothetical protein
MEKGDRRLRVATSRLELGYTRNSQLQLERHLPALRHEDWIELSSHPARS